MAINSSPEIYTDKSRTQSLLFFVSLSGYRGFVSVWIDRWLLQLNWKWCALFCNAFIWLCNTKGFEKKNDWDILFSICVCAFISFGGLLFDVQVVCIIRLHLSRSTSNGVGKFSLKRLHFRTLNVEKKTASLPCQYSHLNLNGLPLKRLA